MNYRISFVILILASVGMSCARSTEYALSNSKSKGVGESTSPSAPSPSRSSGPANPPRPAPPLVEPTFKPKQIWETSTTTPHDPNDPSSSVWNFNGYTYVVWVDSNRRPLVEKLKERELIEKSFIDPDGYTADADGHHRFSIGIDQEGYIHVIGDMHVYKREHTSQRIHPKYRGKQILYWRSNLKQSVAGGFSFKGEWAAPTALLGEGWTSNTAHFFTDNQGELYYTSLMYCLKNHVKGQSAVGLFKYNIDKLAWTALGGPIDNKGSENNGCTAFFWEDSGYLDGNWFQVYQPSFSFDAWNRFHFAITLNHDSTTQAHTRVVYAVSEDGGKNWKKANGAAIAGLPIRSKDGHPNQGDIVASRSAQEPTFSASVNVIADKNGKPGVGVNYVWRAWNGSQWKIVDRLENKKVGYGFRTPDNNLVLISSWMKSVMRVGSWDEQMYSYTIPLDGKIKGLYGIDEYGLRTTGEIYGLAWTGSIENKTIKQFIYKIDISPDPKVP